MTDRNTLQNELDSTLRRMNEIDAQIRKLEIEKYKILGKRVSIFKQINENEYIVEDGIVMESKKSNTKNGDPDPKLQSVLEQVSTAVSEKQLQEIIEITSKTKINWENGKWVGEDGVVHKYRDVFEM